MVFLMERTHRNAIIAHVADQLGGGTYECVEVEWEGKDQTLRIFIDGPDGIVLENCAEVSRLLRDDGELERLVGEDFQMEVSSPGVDRPLRTLDHFTAAVGRFVEVKLLETVDGRKHGSGKLLSIDSDVLKIETNRGEWNAPINRLDRAHLVFDWEEWKARSDD